MLNIALAAACLLVGQWKPTDDRPQLRKIIEHRNGVNGYEEYIEAAIRLADPKTHELMEYATSMASHESHPKVVISSRPSSIPKNAKPEDVYRAAVRCAEPAFEWIRKGNAKPVTNPRSSITAATLFVEFHYFKRAANLLALKARLEFAAGNFRSGGQTLLDELTFARKAPLGPTISFLAECAEENIGEQELVRHLDKLLPSGIESLRAWSIQAANEPTALIPAAGVQRREVRLDWDYLSRHPKEVLYITSIPDKTKAEITRRITTLPDAARNRLYNEYIQGREDPWDSMQTLLKGPERLWLTRLKEDDPDRDLLLTYVAPADRARLMEVLGYFLKDIPLPSGLDKKKVQSLLRPKDLSSYREIVPGDNLPSLAFVFEYFMFLRVLSSGGDDNASAYMPLQEVAVKSRIRLRLVKLTMDVCDFRLRNHRLPNTLAEVEGHDPLDSFTGKPYRYTTDKTGAFKVTCPTPTLGEISLE